MPIRLTAEITLGMSTGFFPFYFKKEINEYETTILKQNKHIFQGKDKIKVDSLSRGVCLKFYFP